MNISETSELNNFGILQPCSVTDCINFIVKNDGGIVKECCKLNHNENLRPCKHYIKSKDK